SGTRATGLRGARLGAEQAEVWAHRKQVEDEGRQRDGRLIDVVLQPYEEVCAANLAAVMRRSAQEMARSRSCAVDPAAVDVQSMLPFWNRPARRAAANVGAGG